MSSNFQTNVLSLNGCLVLEYHTQQETFSNILGICTIRMLL